MMNPDLANILRLLMIMLGGIVVGSGFSILRERAGFYLRHNLPQATRAMWVLALMNALVLGYVATTLIQHWNDEGTWRLPASFAIFAAKAWFFYLLRATGIEQERRLLFADAVQPPA
jgi:MFS family permease